MQLLDLMMGLSNINFDWADKSRISTFVCLMGAMARAGQQTSPQVSWRRNLSCET